MFLTQNTSYKTDLRSFKGVNPCDHLSLWTGADLYKEQLLPFFFFPTGDLTQDSDSISALPLKLSPETNLYLMLGGCGDRDQGLLFSGHTLYHLSHAPSTQIIFVYGAQQALIFVRNSILLSGSLPAFIETTLIPPLPWQCGQQWTGWMDGVFFVCSALCTLPWVHVPVFTAPHCVVATVKWDPQFFSWLQFQTNFISLYPLGKTCRASLYLYI
jgi:hypothetical protein